MLENENSVKNQEIKRKFIEREVLTCQSSLVEELINKEIFQLEEIENFYKDNTKQIEKIEKLEEEKEKLEDQLKIYKENKQEEEIFQLEEIEKIESEIEELEEEEEDPQEIFEWWLITEWLAQKLREKQEPILENEYGIWWGRTCTGQAILLDSVITEICSDLQILEGQKHEWE